MIGFREIPQNLRVPLFFAEFDPSKANSGAYTFRTLLLGQIASAGTFTPGQAVIDQGEAATRAGAGAGSMLAEIRNWYRRRDSFGEVWLLPLADNGAGVAASGSIQVTAGPTAPGTLALYIGVYPILIGLSAGMTTAQVATAIHAAIAAQVDVPVTATVSTSTVTITHRHKGLIGNDLLLGIGLRGSAGGEVLPAGLAMTVTQLTNGTTAPALDTALANLGDRVYDATVLPYTDSASLASVKSWLAARWAWDKAHYGHAFAALKGNLSAATTFGLAQNDPHLTVMPFNGGPQPPTHWAANMTGAFATSLRADPGLPLHFLPLDVWAPPPENRFNISERNVLYWDGLSGFTVADDGTVITDTIVTTYQKNPQGVPDDSYLYVERMYVLAAAVRRLKSRVVSTYGRFKLASDGTRFRPGANIVTPEIIRDTILGEYRAMERDGLVQAYDFFRDNLIVERNSGNRCRVDGLLPIVDIDQFRQFAGLIQFRNSTEAL